MLKAYLSLVILLPFSIFTQASLTVELLEQSAIRFSLTEEEQLSGKARELWLEWIGENQFVGLAEVHNSAQLSYFTKALIQVLAEKDFQHFAIEMGPNSTVILQDATKIPDQTLKNIRDLNRKYGRNAQSKTPMIFANKVEDAVFVEEASRLGYTYCGLDQEFAYAYEMLIDHLYEKSESRSKEFDQAYQKAKSTIQKVIFKNKYKGQYTYCWYPESEELNDFFSFLQDPVSQKIINDLRTSWDIYCKSATGQGSNQQRADYMKKNFEDYLGHYGNTSKVFVKLGSVHLTHGLSPFGVDDMGKYLNEKAEKNETGFLTIRHLITYRNGKSNIGKPAWKNTQLFLELGRKDQWTVVDLRPFRKMLESGELTTNEKIQYELKSYDLLLISPDDQFPKVNY